MNSAGVVDESQIVVDDQDRLLAYGDLRLTHTANGELDLKEHLATGDIWDFDYDVMGNLKQVVLPNMDVLDYVIDARDRRVGKKLNGVLVQGFLYGDQVNPVAELDGSGNVVSRFVYVNRSNVPDYLLRSGSTYRLITDHLGSVVAVVDVATGEVVQRRQYDSWGRIVSESTAAGFSQPFGFAGGLWDEDIGLVRFGARDYDPEVGRWTAKDTILFAGGDSNLYTYTLADPINSIDPLGLHGDSPDCGYYDEKCDESDGVSDTLYYCYIAPLPCEHFPSPTEHWGDCVRECLQQCDERGEGAFGCHVAECWPKCEFVPNQWCKLWFFKNFGAPVCPPPSPPPPPPAGPVCE